MKKLKHKYLDCVPEGKFFGKTEFYSSLRNEIIGNDDYENVKKFWEIVHLKKLSKLNDIYNFRDTIIFCKIFENKVKEMKPKFPHNPRKCTLASSLGGCIHQYSSKTIIVLPTQAEIVELFEKTLISGFSCVNTRLAFDTIILLLKNSRG